MYFKWRRGNPIWRSFKEFNQCMYLGNYFISLYWMTSKIQINKRNCYLIWTLQEFLNKYCLFAQWQNFRVVSRSRELKSLFALTNVFLIVASLHTQIVGIYTRWQIYEKNCQINSRISWLHVILKIPPVEFHFDYWIFCHAPRNVLKEIWRKGVGDTCCLLSKLNI